MGLFDRLFGSRVDLPEAEKMAEPEAETVAASMPENWTVTDGRIAELLAANTLTESGASVTVTAAMKNTTVFRCVSLIANTIGMLPLQLYEAGAEKR